MDDEIRRAIIAWLIIIVVVSLIIWFVRARRRKLTVQTQARSNDPKISKNTTVASPAIVAPKKSDKAPPQAVAFQMDIVGEQGPSRGCLATGEHPSVGGHHTRQR
jgi:predicted permease